jgi:molecular chaperone DnaJ
MRGEGEAGYKGGPRGNLYITVSVRQHKYFTRRGFDLLLEMHIPFTVAALGGDVTVPTLNESVKYSVPAGTQNATTFRLKEQGIPKLNASGKGDLFVTVTVDIPKKLTEEQRSLLIKFSQTENSSAGVKSEKKGFFGKK